MYVQYVAQVFAVFPHVPAPYLDFCFNLSRIYFKACIPDCLLRMLQPCCCYKHVVFPVF